MGRPESSGGIHGVETPPLYIDGGVWCWVEGTRRGPRDSRRGGRESRTLEDLGLSSVKGKTCNFNF